MKFHIKTFGCQMNVYDSGRISNMLISDGYSSIDDEGEADIIILNTCYIREKASEKVFSELGRIEKLYRKKVMPIIVVIGCVAKAEGENIFRRAPYVSIVLSSQKYHLLPKLLTMVVGRKNRLIDVGLSGIEKFDNLSPILSSERVGFVSIAEGCDNCCTYCVVPSTRGREVSRPVVDILAEVENLIHLGVLEVNLLGQNVNSFNGIDENGMKSNLATLVKAIAKFPEIRRIRYTTSYPLKSGDELIELHKTEMKLMPFIYLPIQSGSDEILKRMNRKYTVSEYIDEISKYKKLNPEIQVSSDFIVGFPNESDEDFEATLDIAIKMKFIQSYCFKYSARPNTVAGRMEGQVSNKIKSERLKRLQDVLRQNQDEFNKSCIGRVMSVLWTEKSKKVGYIVGKNEYLQIVIAKGSESLIGSITDVKITNGSYANLSAQMLI